MKKLGLSDVIRGKKVKTTILSKNLCPLDHVKRHFKTSSPDTLWVADITYVPIHSGFAYVSFITDVFARFIVEWKVSDNMQTPLVLEALEQAIYERNPSKGKLS